MKFISLAALCLLSSTAEAYRMRQQGVWDEALSGMNNEDEYNADTPTKYKEVKKVVKVDYE